MSEWITVLIVAVVIIYFVKVMTNWRKAGSQDAQGRGSIFNRTSRFAPWPTVEVPAALGVPYGHPARSAAERLEAALGCDMESRVKDRLLLKYPKLGDKEWDWTWFELKRYFLMCALLRGVPMYSKQVDAAWHELLMFTREYEQFCTAFCGQMIHHAPHAQGAEPPADDRAWFDWVYGELFAQAPASGRLWGAFYRTRMSEQRLQELERWGAEDLKKHLFNGKAAEHYSDLDDTIHYLIDRASMQLHHAKSKNRPDLKETLTTNRYGYDPAVGGAGVLSGLIIYHSMIHPDDFMNQMHKEQNEEMRNANGSSGGSYGCSATHIDGNDNPGPGGDSGGSSGGDSGGSSCGSSCGGGCSS